MSLFFLLAPFVFGAACGILVMLFCKPEHRTRTSLGAFVVLCALVFLFAVLVTDEPRFLQALFADLGLLIGASILDTLRNPIP